MEEWKKTGSDHGYHYLGSAIWHLRMGAAFGDSMMRRSKDRNEAVLELDRLAEFFANLVQADLGPVGPDTQHVGDIGDVHGHSNTTYAMPAMKRSANTTSH